MLDKYPGDRTKSMDPGRLASQSSSQDGKDLTINYEDRVVLMSLQTSSDEDLLDRIKQYDNDAYLELYARHHGWVLRFLRKAGNDAEDLAQEVWFDVFRCARTFLPGIGKAWIAGIARNVLADYWKKRLRALEEQMLVYTDEDGATIQTDVADASIRSPAVKLDTDDLLIAALASLPRAERQAIWLTAVKELSPAEAAEAMGASVGRLKQYISRAYSGMRDYLSRILDGSTRGIPDEGATSESQTGRCAAAAANPTAAETAREGEAPDGKAADLNTAQDSAPDRSAASIPQSKRIRPMTAHQRNSRLNWLLRTIPDRAALPHRAQRYSSEITEQQKLIIEWMAELEEMAMKTKLLERAITQGSERSERESE
jgi:RNA polymerase sigma-70 factor (ECF subfamily)